MDRVFEELVDKTSFIKRTLDKYSVDCPCGKVFEVFNSNTPGTGWVIEIVQGGIGVEVSMMEGIKKIDHLYKENYKCGCYK